MKESLIDTIFKQTPYTVKAETPRYFLWYRIQLYSVLYEDTPLYEKMNREYAIYTADRMNKAYRAGMLQAVNIFLEI